MSGRELTPDEQAWCAWARSVQGDTVLAIRRECETESTRAFCEGSRQARAADVELVRAAGCLCRELNDNFRVKGGDGEDWDEIVIHARRCPEALALAIEARGKE